MRFIILFMFTGIFAAPKSIASANPGNLRQGAQVAVQTPQPKLKATPQVSKQIKEAMHVAQEAKEIAQNVQEIVEAVEDIEANVDSDDNPQTSRRPRISIPKIDTPEDFKERSEVKKLFKAYSLALVILQCGVFVSSCTQAVILFIRLKNNPESVMR